jgi:hypothetical protein
MEDEAELRAKLTSPKASVRYEAAEMLRVQEWISPAGLSALQAALHDPDASVRESAASALKVHEQDDVIFEEVTVEEVIPPDELPSPAGLTMVQGINELNFIYKAHAESSVLPNIGLSLIMLLALYRLRTGIPEISLFLSIFFFCYLIFVIYLARAPIINRATFMVSKDELRFEYTPLPFVPTRQVSTKDLLQLGVEEKKFSMSGAQTREVPTNDMSLLSVGEKVVSPLNSFFELSFPWFFQRKYYYLVANLQDGRRLMLIEQKLGTGTLFPYEVLNYIVVHTHRWLGIQEKMKVKVPKTATVETQPG